jgi:protein ImuB
MFACIHAPDAGAKARSFSPWVELHGEDTAVFRLTERQIAFLKTDSIPLAIASSIEAAILAARNLPGFTYLEPGKELEILGPLPVDVLPPDPGLFQAFELWGIRTLADLARLPEQGLAERLGEQGLRYQKLARGILSRPLVAPRYETVYEEYAEMDHPIELKEPLMFLIGRFLFDLSAKLKSQSLAAQELRLTLNTYERVLRLPFPSRDVKFLVKQVEHSLDRQPPSGPIEKIRVFILPTVPRRVQSDLFIPAAPEPEKLELTLAKIRALVGEKNVRIPQIRDTYRPGWGAAESKLSFHHFRPPLQARVQTEAGIPTELWTRGLKGKVECAAGPWRTNGDWWKADQWDRDEWDLTLADGVLYRLFLDREKQRWFLEGFYD